MFLAARERGFVLKSPLSPEETMLANPRPILAAAMTPEQTACLANHTRTVDWRTVLLLGFYCGMELLEATNQPWTGVDFVACRIAWVSFVRGGNSLELRLAMHRVLGEHLQKVRRVCPGEWVTPSLRGINDQVLRSQIPGTCPGSQPSDLNGGLWQE
jgi:hypothetical protein